MPEPVNSHTQAPRASLNAFFRMLANSGKANSLEAGGLVRWQTAIAHPWFNGVLISRPPSGDETSIIQEQMAYFRLQGVDSFTWWAEVGISVDSWADQLLSQGFTLNQGPPGMVCDLQDLPAAIPTPPGFTIQSVHDPSVLKDWTETFCTGYGLPSSFIHPSYEIFAEIGFQSGLHHYMGYLDGKPAAAASLFYSDEIAGIYNVAVLEQARGQGLGAAITLTPLLEARAQGYTLGALQSSEMGFNVYRRLGFRKVSDVTHFQLVFGEPTQK